MGRIIATLVLAVCLLHAQSSALPPRPSGLPSVESLAPSEADDGLDVIWYETLVWGTIRYTWMIERGGEGRIRQVGQPERTFAVTRAEFDRIHRRASYRRLTSRPEGRCRPGPTDGPYGSIRWRIRGEVSQVTWSSGYRCANSSFIDARLTAADAGVWELANR